MILSSCILAICVGAGAPGHAENWPQFRGEHSRGIPIGGEEVERGLPTRWSKTENVVWKTPLPGRGWSSPIVWGDHVFVTTVQLERGEFETVKKGLYFGGERKPSKVVHRWMVYCLDFNSGEIRWEKEAHRGVPKRGIHLKNSMASETPVTDGKHVYAYFGNVGLFCYDFQGKEIWAQKWGDFPTKLEWGTAASPVLYEDRIYVVNDNEKKSFLVALEKASGNEVWRKGRDEKTNWATPFVWKNELRTELVVPGAKRIRSYSLEEGREGEVLWELGGMSVLTIPTPFAHDGLLYVTSGYVLDSKKPLYAIRPGGKGDISLEGKEDSNPWIAWSHRLAGPYNPTPVLYQGRFYVLYDRGLMACFDAQTGKEIYRKQRIGKGVRGAYTSSPWAYDGKIFCLNEDGDTVVIQAGDQFKVLHTNPLDELCMATPAIVRDSLLLRTESHLYRIANRKKKGE